MEISIELSAERIAAECIEPGGVGEDIGFGGCSGECGECFSVAGDDVSAIDVEGDDAWFGSVGGPRGYRQIASVVLCGDEEPQQLRCVGGAVLGDGSGDGAEWCVVFAFDDDGAECAVAGREAGRAYGVGQAEGGLEVRVEADGVWRESDFGGDGGEAGGGAGGGEEGGEGFEGAHAANVAEAVWRSGCETLRGGAKDCGLKRSRVSFGRATNDSGWIVRQAGGGSDTLMMTRTTQDTTDKALTKNHSLGVARVVSAVSASS